jgi:hypothetical protein
MRAYRRTLLALLPTATFLVVGLGFGAVHKAHADTVTASITVTTTTVVDAPADDSDHVCEEDQPCWNPCTMGVNGTYLTTDPRHWVPGPCDQTTALPYSGRFSLVAVPFPIDGLVCPGGGTFMRVAVYVVTEGTNDVRTEESTLGCARTGDPFADFGDVLPWMYRSAAAQLPA